MSGCLDHCPQYGRHVLAHYFFEFSCRIHGKDYPIGLASSSVKVLLYFKFMEITLNICIHHS